MASLMHDMQAPGVVLVDDGYHTGIDAEVDEARLNNQSMHRQSIASVGQRRESLAGGGGGGGSETGMLDRRNSVADSMKSLLLGRRGSGSK
ncbi:hypothetical protein A1O1_01312 [Capronia coronata CBS 617.96]|uniref:Uncharacterized protein n=1 Tax=Capronia coronata CBS 617.96 TaxID=1182541 RepID=W9Z3M3_9EURO|nr:uncharacterized protein A1O1_01312 [Capronia coronata CBS 617.96]EXJ96186.1 hypothetical protein A1O1_01312 [Capronia coronata CBS 617.96]